MCRLKKITRNVDIDDVSLVENACMHSEEFYSATAKTIDEVRKLIESGLTMLLS